MWERCPQGTEEFGSLSLGIAPLSKRIEQGDVLHGSEGACKPAHPTRNAFLDIKYHVHFGRLQFQGIGWTETGAGPAVHAELFFPPDLIGQMLDDHLMLFKKLQAPFYLVVFTEKLEQNASFAAWEYFRFENVEDKIEISGKSINDRLVHYVAT